MAIARYYNEEKNTDNRFFSGVPLRDLTQEEWDELAEWQKNSIDNAPDDQRMYFKSKPKKKAEPSEDGGADGIEHLSQALATSFAAVPAVQPEKKEG